MYGAFRLNDSAAISPPDFLDYRAGNQVFESLGAMVIAPNLVTVPKGSGPERLSMAYVSAGLITTLGVSPTLDATSSEKRNQAPRRSPSSSASGSGANSSAPRQMRSAGPSASKTRAARSSVSCPRDSPCRSTPSFD